MSDVRILLDTNIAVAAINGQSRVLSRLVEYPSPALPIAVVSELYFGVYNSAKSEQNESDLRGFLSGCMIIEADLEIAKAAAGIRYRLKMSGRTLPANDVWIAAIALHLDVPLVSRDNHFQYVDEIRHVVW